MSGAFRVLFLFVAGGGGCDWLAVGGGCARWGWRRGGATSAVRWRGLPCGARAGQVAAELALRAQTGPGLGLQAEPATRGGPSAGTPHFSRSALATAALPRDGTCPALRSSAPPTPRPGTSPTAGRTAQWVGGREACEGLRVVRCRVTLLRDASRDTTVGRFAGARLGRSQGRTGSRLKAQGSRLKAQGSRFTAHGSRLTTHGSWLMAHGSWLMAHGSWLMAHGSRLMAHGSWLMR
jgi:hypothetical protein